MTWASRFSSRALLALCLLAAGLGADCKVGREVVGERNLPPVDPVFCPPERPCDEEVEFDLLPEFVAERVCTEGDCSERTITELPERSARASFEHLVFQASEPTELRLEHVSFENVLLELRGPVTLHLGPKGRLASVRILLRAEAGEPRLVLEEVELFEAFASSEGAGPSGALVLERAAVSRSQLSAHTLEVSNSTVYYSRLRATRGILGHARIRYSELGLQTGWVAAGEFEEVRTIECDSLTLSGTRTYGELSQLGPCTDTLRLLFSDQSEGDLEGPLHLENSTLNEVRLGARADTLLDTFTSELRYLTFCPRTQRVTLGDATLVRCAHCEELGEALPVCAFGDLSSRLSNNACPAFASEPEVCEPPWPVRAAPN